MSLILLIFTYGHNVIVWSLAANIHWIPIVSYSGELPALSLLLIFQLEYLGILKNTVEPGYKEVGYSKKTLL